MAELVFKYGSMDSGKTTELLQQTYDYSQAGVPFILIKPDIDSKGDNKVVSRAGGSCEVDFMVSKTDSIRHLIETEERPFCILVDEAQFLMPFQVD